MYRPKEPENRRPVQSDGMTGRRTDVSRAGSLLDRVDEAESFDPPPENYRRLAPSEPIARETPEPPRPKREESTLERSLNAQIRSLAEIGPADILLWLRDGIKWIVLAAIIGTIAALAYALTATPRYTAYTDLIVDPANLNVVSDDVFASSSQRDSQLLEVESKLRVLTSGNVLRHVITELDLANDPEFNRPGFLDPLVRLISGPRPEGDTELGILRALSERVSAQREERSFVVSLGVWTEDPEKSVRLADAIVRAFETELFQSAAESAGRVAAGLTSRLDELRAAVTQAEERVEQFKRDNKLQLNAGELASSRISSALDTQVLDAQQRLIQAEARYEQMQSAVASRRAATDTVFDSPAMANLRTSYATLQQQIGSLSLTYGARHPRLISLQSEQAALDRAIGDEAGRILRSAKTDVDQARSTLDELRRRADAERSTVFTNSDAQVRLRELERDAQAKAAVYETYLGRTHQITERQQIDATNVRVISPAVPPKAKSWPPRTLILLAAGAVAGAALGIGLAIALGLLRHLGEARRRLSYPHRYA
ncbi:GumC family protein [Rhizobium sp. LCM 4573]|uniref:GumC family protein n=1 Tax=Rhizobium sp. LCM 4573 TaxID=1848291 RepID=UPI0008DB02C5|nr:GumC family protein [Rhizobium sp. LCM 4573]OHV84864.1 cell shape-determining protein [Rhizobium sp. LCM 4573]